MVWCGGLILPQLCPTSHSNIHVSMVLLQTLWPTLVPSTASLWLSCTISQDLNPIQCCGSARKENSLMQPSLTALGAISRTNSNKAQWRQERNHQLYLLPGAAHMAEKNDQKVAKHFIFSTQAEERWLQSGASVQNTQ